MSKIKIIHLPHIRVHNANALSSPFTVGFPAMTAWLGFTHALQRKLNQQGLSDLELPSVAVVSHQCDLQTYQGPGDYVHSIIGTANPLDKDGSRSAFIEEARCHLDISLVIEYQAGQESEKTMEQAEFIDQLTTNLTRMKIAGGDIVGFAKPKIRVVDNYDDAKRNEFLRQLMPGYALIERRELMIEAMEQGQDAMDALLGYLTVNHSCERAESGDVVWHSQRKVPGWIVPIATGFQGISELGNAKNQRDPDTPHRFAESVVTLGEFKMVHNIKSLDDMLWYYHADLDNSLYLCQQNNQLEQY